MKKLFKMAFAMLGLVVGLAVPQTLKAQVENDPAWYPYYPALRNSQNDYFASFSVRFAVNFTYSADYGFGSGTAYFDVADSFAPYGTPGSANTYWFEASNAAQAAAQDDANYWGYGNVYNVNISTAYMDYEYYNYAFRLNAVAPSASNANIPVGVPWEPTFTSTGSGGTPMWCAAGANPWVVGQWTFLAAPRTYDLYVGTKCAPGYEGNVVDPIEGRIMIRVVPYTLDIY